jgi:phosphoadenosine phosphosulfate reductase
MFSLDLTAKNAELKGRTPQEIIEWALSLDGVKPVLSTNFGPYEAVILHAVTQIKPDVDILWADSGYNTPETYRFAHKLTRDLNLNLHTFTPRVSAAYRQANLGGIPSLEDAEAHKLFTQEVKLEPFFRGLESLGPNLWFTALRKEQTDFRAGLDILSTDPRGILKVSPFFNYSETDMAAYLQEHQLPNEPQYFDPTKVLGKRECGLHLDQKNQPKVRISWNNSSLPHD